MSKIFISYRRTDTESEVGRLYDRMTDRFGMDDVFKDVDSIPLGADFRDTIIERVSSSSVLLAVIGPKWTTVSDDDDKPRLFDPDDYVRIEIETALTKGIRIIPVLIDDTMMPKQDELPDSISKLHFRNAAKLRPDPDFNGDAYRIAAAVAETINDGDGSSSNSATDRYKMMDEIIENLGFVVDDSYYDEIIKLKTKYLWQFATGAAVLVIIAQSLAVFFERESPFSGTFGIVFASFIWLYLIGYVVLISIMIRSRCRTAEKLPTELENRFRELTASDATDSEIAEFREQIHRAISKYAS